MTTDESRADLERVEDQMWAIYKALKPDRYPQVQIVPVCVPVPLPEILSTRHFDQHGYNTNEQFSTFCMVLLIKQLQSLTYI